MKIILGTVLLLVAASAASLVDNATTIVDNANTNSYRLPNNSVPISYSIKLIPYLVENNFTYDGESTIKIKILKPSSSITLHVLDLTIHESATSLVCSANKHYKIVKHTYNTEKQFLTLNFATKLPTGRYTLYLKYVGVLDDKVLSGFFRSSYTNDNGETVWMAATQFKATVARRAFPCWDEPALKATFNISIKHDVNYTAISNMPTAKKSAVDKTDNKVWTNFKNTPIISTYSVAFAVSDYGHVSNNNTKFRVWSRKNALRQIDYAFAQGEAELKYIEEYTSIPLPVAKIDQISIPDSSITVMENWGLVTVSELDMLYKDGVDTATTQQDVSQTVSIGLVQQWFGNLVSPSWWKHVWLSEGFGVYFEFYIPDMLQDNWRLMEKFVVRVIQGSAFVDDASDTTHPMNQDVSSQQDIYENFDAITYGKAAAVIHMMSNILTAPIFRAGLTKYLNNNAYGVVTPDHLWVALQQASDQSGSQQPKICVKQVMDTWVDQPGYPVITVTRNYKTGTANVSQERFFQSGAGDDGTRWWVPISYTTQSRLNFSTTSPSVWIPQGKDNIVLSGLKSNEWTILNIQQSGYYRVNYDNTNWQLIAKYLDSDNYVKIHPVNRAQIIDDSFNLALTNRTSFSVFLNIAVYIRRDIDYIPWYSMLGTIDYLYQKLTNTRSFSLYKRFFVESFEKSIVTLGYDDRKDDEHLAKFQRMNMIIYACSEGSQECRSNATARLAAYLKDPVANPTSPDLANWVFCSGLNNANATIWNEVLDLYTKTHSNNLINYLGCSEDTKILTNYMSLATTENSKILKQDASDAFASLYQNSAQNINFAFDYLINNFDKLYAFWDDPNDEMARHISAFGTLLTTKEQLTKLKALVNKHSDVFGSAGSSAIANTEANVQWVQTYEPIFYQWFTNFYKV